MFGCTQKLMKLPCRVYNICTVTTKPFYAVEIPNNDGVAVLTMQKAPANTFNLEALQEFQKTIRQIKADNVNGLIITSSLPKIFSAGLELTEMYKPEPRRLAEFWRQLQETWLELYTTPFPTAAAITGHAPAAGCLFSMACEYRVMLKGNYKIGMNETAIGIFVPVWAQLAFRNLLNDRDAEIALSLSTMFTSNESLKICLIDEEAFDVEDVMMKCKAFINQFRNVPFKARAASKLIYRRNTIDTLKKVQKDEIKMFVECVLDPKVQNTLENYLKQLKNKNK